MSLYFKDHNIKKDEEEKNKEDDQFKNMTEEQIIEMITQFQNE
jgi:hypothetical protein